MQLLIHDSAFGDFVLSWPLLRAVARAPVESSDTPSESPRGALPDATLDDPSPAHRPAPSGGAAAAASVAPTTSTWLVGPWQRARLAARLIPGVVPVDVAQPRWSRLFAPGFAEVARAAADRSASEGPHVPGLDREAAEMAMALASAHLVLSYVSRGGDAWADNLRALAPQARLAFVPPRPERGWPGHVVEWQLRCVAEAGVELAAVEPDAAIGDPPAGDRQGGVVIHPGSGGASKRWPRERFAELVRGLRADGAEVLPVLGLVEWQQWGDVALREWCEGLGARVLGSPGELARVLAGARAYVGNDSGPTHLAAQLGLPTLGLFGPTSPTRWRPRGPHVHVLAPDSPRAMDYLSVARVRAALAGIVDG